MKIHEISNKRILVYCLGVICMSFGLALNVKSFLGVAPILTTPNILSGLTGWEFANMLFLFYVMFIVLEFIFQKTPFRAYDLIQFPIGLIITRLVALCQKLIPVTADSHIAIRFVVLGLAIIITGIGVALSVDMKIAPNPADGLAAAVGERFNLGLGMGKNIVDLTSVAVSFVISIITTHSLGPIGIGTIAAGLLVGRVIALFNKLFKEKMCMACDVH